jgi:hypothetical protein
MRKYILKGISLGLCITCYQICSGQNNDTPDENLNLLRAPSSAAYSVIGVANTEMPRFTDVKSLAVSLQQSTTNFTAIPRTWGIEFPVGKRTKVAGKAENKKEPPLLSIGLSHMGPSGYEDVDTLKRLKVGVGFKWSIIQPKFDDATRAIFFDLAIKNASRINRQQQYNQSLVELHKHSKALYEINSQLKQLRQDGSDADNLSRKESDRATAEQKEYRARQDVDRLLAQVKSRNLAVNEVISEINEENPARTGALLDVTSALGWHAVDKSARNIQILRGGFWLSGGYEGVVQGLHLYALARYLINPSTYFDLPAGAENIEEYNTGDAGFRILYNPGNKRLTVSAEAIGRKVFKSAVVKDSWKYMFNATYEVDKKNKLLQFSFGRDFDGVYNKDGNILAALNFIIGFGSEL